MVHPPQSIHDATGNATGRRRYRDWQRCWNVSLQAHHASAAPAAAAVAGPAAVADPAADLVAPAVVAPVAVAVAAAVAAAVATVADVDGAGDKDLDDYVGDNVDIEADDAWENSNWIDSPDRDASDDG